MIIEGWKYTADKVNGSDSYSFQIETPEKQNNPATLFKYYSINELNVNALLESKFYVSHPDQFNDLYDCCNNLILPDKESVRILLNHGPFKTQKIFDELWKSNRMQVEDAFHLGFKEITYKKIGILCLTNEPCNILMWAYYGNNRGFLVEYDYKKFPFKHYGPFPINYSKNIKPIKLEEVGAAIAILYQSNIKLDCWSHEKEWRILVHAENANFISPSEDRFNHSNDINRLVKYDLNNIKSIYLGNRFFDPKELFIIDNNTLKIKINQETEINSLKKKLIAYIIKHNLVAKIILRSESLNKLNFRSGNFTTIQENEYLFSAIS